MGRVEVKLIPCCFATTMRNQNRYHEKLELPWRQGRFLIGTVSEMNSIFWSSTFWSSITLYPSAPLLAGLVHTHQCLRQSPELHCRSFISALNSDPGSCGRRLPFTDSRTVMISEKEVEQAAGTARSPTDDGPKHTLPSSGPALPASLWREGLLTWSISRP